MQPHGGEIEIGEIVVSAINCEQTIERLAPAERIMCDSQPKLFSLSRQIPFRGETCQPDFALRVFLAGALSIVPERFTSLLSKLLSGIRDRKSTRLNSSHSSISY